MQGLAYEACVYTCVEITQYLYYSNLILLYHCRYGSIADYLVSAGFTLEEQQKLKDIFLETLD